MIKNIFNFQKGLLIFLISLFLLSSCKHSNLSGLPGEDPLNSLYTDTLSFNSITIREDSVRAFAGSPNFGTLAYFEDPIFGKSISNMAFQVIPSRTVESFGSNPILDSVVLVLSYQGFYGDSASVFNAKVHKLNEKLADSNYFSNYKFGFDASVLGSKSFVAKVRDSILVQSILKGKKDTVKLVPPQLRIKLDNAFGQQLLQASNVTRESFLESFKGFYIELEPSVQNGKGGIIQFNLTSLKTALSLYYRTSTNNVEDTLQFDYPTGSSTLKFNNFVKDYTGTEIQAQLNGSNKGDQFVYLQPLAGVNAKFEIPNLKTLLRNGLISVNKARLRLSIDPNSFSSYAYPGSLLIRNLDSAGIYTDIAVTSVKSNGTYEFDLSTFIQDLITNRTQSAGLFVYPNGRLASKERLVLGGFNNASLKPKLILTYTEVE